MSVTRAICAAFTPGKEPGIICDDPAILGDECDTSHPGYQKCQVSNNPSNENRCIGAFGGLGYDCRCGKGWKAGVDEAGEPSCRDVNECLESPPNTLGPECLCPRCACINTLGGYNCTGALVNKCLEPEYKNNGCWVDPHFPQVRSHPPSSLEP